MGWIARIAQGRAAVGDAGRPAPIGAVGVLAIAGILGFRLADWALFGNAALALGPDAKLVSRLVQVVALCGILAFDRWVSYQARSAAAVLYGATATYVASLAAYTLTGGEVALYTCSVLHGVFQTVALVCWGYVLSSIDPRRSALCITGAFALFGVASWVLADIPAPAVGAIAMLAPVVAAVCCPPCARRAEVPFAPDGPFTREVASRVPRSVVLLLALCIAGSVFVHSLVPTDRAQTREVYSVLNCVASVAVWAVYAFYLVVLRKTDASRLWPVFAVVVLGGLIGYTTFVNVDEALAVNLLTATQTCNLSFCWVVAADVVYANRLPRAFAFGLATLVFAEPITLVITLRPLLAPDAVGAAGEMGAVVLVMGFALAIVAACVALASIEGARKPRVIETHLQPPPPSTLSRAIDELGERYLLSDREREVALRLARGYTLPQTAEALGVTLDTVRSHVKKLYLKLNIHKKQQLIELVEEEMGRNAPVAGEPSA